MKVAMVNDAAFVGETIAKYLPYEVVYIQRNRSLWSKTVKLAWKELNLNADLFHIHYLLQDCYLAQKLGKAPLIGHAHGSDLREALKTKRYGWIVKSNLEQCDKILVAQPTILDIAKRYSESAEYIPIPFDPELFYPKPLPNNTPKQAFIASTHNFRVKGTDKFLLALAQVPNVEVKSFAYGPDFPLAAQLAADLNLKIRFISPVNHACMNNLYWESDIVLGSWGIGQLDTVAIEAMACGRPVIHLLKEGYYPTVPLAHELSSVQEVAQQISNILGNRKLALGQVESQLKYVYRVHDAKIVSKRIEQIYGGIK